MSARFGMYLQQKDYQEKQNRLKRVFTLRGKYANLLNISNEFIDEKQCSCENCKCKKDEI